MIRFKYVAIAFIFSINFIISSCSKAYNTTGEVSSSSQPNILFIIADDLGKDALSGFSEGGLKPSTPNIDSFKNSGVTFTNNWVNPTCSPTRSSMITGKYGYRTGVKNVNDVLSSSENILHNYINQQTDDAYATAVIGKWHLAGNGNNTFNPEALGMDYYAGLMNGGVANYSQWRLTSDGAFTNETSYITEKFTDLSIDWVQQQSKPWFLWLAYTAPHPPYHLPPSEMHSQGDLPEYSNAMDPLPYYLAAIEAMDYQIGRLLKSIPDEELANTVIIFIGDNGTPNPVAQSPYTPTTVKGTLYQGGINTPLIVTGANVSRAGATDDNLISGTDIFATIADLAGASVSTINDSKSFKPLLQSSGTHRNFQYSESNDGTTDYWVISNGSFKLFTYVNGDKALFDLTTDPYETHNLLNGTLTASQQAEKQSLEDELAQIRS